MVCCRFACVETKRHDGWFGRDFHHLAPEPPGEPAAALWPQVPRTRSPLTADTQSINQPINQPLLFSSIPTSPLHSPLILLCCRFITHCHWLPFLRFLLFILNPNYNKWKNHKLTKFVNFLIGSCYIWLD